MPTAFDVASQHNSYSVNIRQGAITELLAAHSDALVIIDDVLKKQVKLSATHKHLYITATEESKEYEAIAVYLKALRDARVTRKSVLIAIGGGVIQDISGFMASIYMRGVAWHYAPTTLLGMVDSCIGGKSSINVRGTKNLVGTFYPPQSIIVDPAFINTLQHQQIIDGLCEAAKICFAHPESQAFEEYLKLKCLEPLTPERYERLIDLSLRTKKWFIEKDEFDQNERLLLNFGHTFGHAIETASNYGISHGVGVGLGILCAIAFSQDAKAHPRTKQLQAHILELLRTLPGLSAEIQALNIEKILEAFQSDKKHSLKEYTVIIPDKNGYLIREKVARTPQCDKALAHAIEKGMQAYG